MTERDEPQLTTVWICVATSGQTLDGRHIKPEWLLNIANNYDPTYYTALIWEEHNRKLDNLGEVLGVKAEESNGETKLYARLRPNLKLMEYNKQGQKLFCSIEVEEDFRGQKGIFYLGGLAVTDSPSSVGTNRLQFSINRSHFSRKKSRVSLSSPTAFNLSDGLRGTKNRWFAAISGG